ncbi:MAG: glycosyltransferase family 39 protein, partial [Chloroflexota bacterium]
MRIPSVTKALLLICVGALLFRLLLLQFVSFPGIADPNHYYNMGVRLVEGHGFTIDYIWQYSLPPASIVHPEEHWMPLTAVLAAAPMALFGESVRSALLPFVLLGALLPALAYWGARQLELSKSAALFSAAALAVLPEFTLYSLRTDTMIPSALFTCLSILLLNCGLQRKWSIATSGADQQRLRGSDSLIYTASGIAAGLAYLTRNDGILLLPMLVVTLLVYRVWRKNVPVFPSRAVILMPIIALIVVTPWLIRNLNEIGMIGSPETSSMFFFTDHNNHYAFGRHFTLETMLAAQTPAQIIGKRLFEMAAAVKVMIQSFDLLLPVAVAGGLLLLIALRDKRRLLTIAPALILLLGVFVAYTVFIPYKAQAGSFKKAYLSILPLLLPLGAYALERAITDSRIRFGAMALVVALAGANAIDTVRLDQQTASNYLAAVEKMATQARTLPDTNGDGEIILMTSDPYIVRFAGLRSIMYPDEDRDTIIEIARRYGVDYLLMPANRPQFDALINGTETDPRFVPLDSVPGTPFSFS